MIDLKRVRSVVLDIAGANRSYDRQDDLSEFIWHLLERHYRIFLVSSDGGEGLSGEDFEHPQLVFLREDMPPGRAVLKAHPELTAPETLWITDDETLQHWIGEASLPFMYLRHEGSGRKAPAGGQHLPHLSELSALLDPTGLLLGDLVRMVDDLRRFRPEGPLVVAVGGPPLSGYEQFAVDLRTHLQDAGHPLVELLDVRPLMRSTEELLEAGGDAADAWTSPEAAGWLRDELLGPLAEGRAVYAEALPLGLPRDFEAHFPLYVSEASVLIVLGELVFTPVVADAAQLSVLLEVTPEETTRRLYEIPQGERFDPKFIEQYRTREGRIYEDYLRRNSVRERVSVRVDANHEGALVLEQGDDRPLV